MKSFLVIFPLLLFHEGQLSVSGNSNAFAHVMPRLTGFNLNPVRQNKKIYNIKVLCCIFFCFVCNNCHIKNRIRVAQADVDIFI